jgi:hypothetical protein
MDLTIFARPCDLGKIVASPPAVRNSVGINGGHPVVIRLEANLLSAGSSAHE